MDFKNELRDSLEGVKSAHDQPPDERESLSSEVSNLDDSIENLRTLVTCVRKLPVTGTRKRDRSSVKDLLARPA
jgi:hypothetical protein